MGGCRCYFRDCHVSNARYRHMHFFRFPIKEAERYKKWREFSQMEHMLEYPEVRRRNTNICARHFRLECFMNYKMDRLAPNAVPTIMRLSKDKALDFELDIDNGVLVTLEDTKFKHLIPPENFECPLYLTNDKVLFRKLKEWESQEYWSNMNSPDGTDYVELGESGEYEDNDTQKPTKSLNNFAHIVESIQIATPSSKRVIELDGEEMPVFSANLNKRKCKILNKTYSLGSSDSANGSTVILTPRSIHLKSHEVSNNEVSSAETNQIEDQQELVNDEQLLLKNEIFIEDDEDIAYIEVHPENGDNSHYDLSINESDTSVVKLKSAIQMDCTIKNTENQELIKMQNRVLELEQTCQDYDTLRVKLSLLEIENKELKATCQENEEMNNKLISLQMENSEIKHTLADYESLKDKLKNYCEENKQLKEEAVGSQILKVKLSSREEEMKELKNLVENLRYEKSKVVKDYYLENGDEPSSKIIKVKDLNNLKRKLKMSQEQFHSTDRKLKKVENILKEMEEDNDRITQNNKELEKSFHSIQNSLDSKEKECITLKSDYNNLQEIHTILTKKYCKLEAVKSEESTVSTSHKKGTNNKIATIAMAQPLSANSFTKSQLFNSIKRYLSASMVPLLRMEMFGGLEREWKSDERQVAVDILGLGEVVYKYFTDEWRIRLPALREVRNWLSEEQQLIDYEEDI